MIMDGGLGCWVKCAVMGEMLSEVRRLRGFVPRIRAARSPVWAARSLSGLSFLRLGRPLSAWVARSPPGSHPLSVWAASVLRLCRVRMRYEARLLSEWVPSVIRMRIICSPTACCVFCVCTASVSRLRFSWAASVRRPLFLRDPSSPRLASLLAAAALPLCQVFAASS